MKKILAIFLLLAIFQGSYAQTKKDTAASHSKTTAPPGKYNDNVDDRMKGPKGEKVYIGPNGGRYYLKDGKKVYVEYNGNKKKKG